MDDAMDDTTEELSTGKMHSISVSLLPPPYET